MELSVMAARATFTDFDPYKLTEITVTDRELGHGSYAMVLELDYMGLKCAGKKIHELLLRQGDMSYTVRRFEEECRLLSQVRHPNIVQFLGVFFQQGVRAPILVMEFLPTNLTSCIERYGILPKEISHSILCDVALGLCYLHSQNPPIIHRDLSSNNILLTPNMTAKISDLGVARILNLTPLQVSHMTGTPGTPAYMPPEVMVANPKYDTSVDEFSYGILMIHVFSGQWPEPQVGPNRTEQGRLIPVSEAERREVFLQAIGTDNPLMVLIHRCINNDPHIRPHAIEIADQVREIASQFPAPFSNQLEMLGRIEVVEGEKRVLLAEEERKDRDIQQKQGQVSLLAEEIQVKEQQMIAEIDQLKLAHSSEMEQLQLNLTNLNTQYQLMKAEKEAEVTELTSKAAALQTQVDNVSSALNRERELYKSYLAEEEEQYQLHLRKEKQEFEAQLAKEKEANKRLMVNNRDLQFNLSTEKSKFTSLQVTTSKLQTDIMWKNTTIQKNSASIKRKDSEIEAKSRALEEKDATISAMSKQLTKAKEYLATKKQGLQACISWKQCAELPIKFRDGNTTIINDKIYCGGVVTDDDHEYIVYCYDTPQDKWTTLPPLPVRYFGLGHVDSKLVALGGNKRGDDQGTDEVYSFDERSRKWKQTIPPMPTARWSTSVLTLRSALVVAGGASNYTTAVEIFKSDTSRWYRSDPLPRPCCDISLVAIGNTCYALGGYRHPTYLNQALYAPIDDILGNAKPVKSPTRRGSNDTQSTWKVLPNTPTYEPAAAVLAGSLIAIGGKETSYGGNDKKEIYSYSSLTNSWVYISDLPAPRLTTAVAVLSSTKFLVIGGWGEGARLNTVYMGTLTCSVSI